MADSETSPPGSWARRADGRVIRIAHRGASGRTPENTHTAFAAALDQGVDAIELDVQLSADGELVVIHDETLDRTTNGLGPVRARTWAELAQLDAGRWKGERFRGERIPRLADVLEQINGRVLLNVEIKSARDAGQIEERLAALAQARDAAGWVLFSSSHTAALRGMRAVAPWAHLGIVRSQPPPAEALPLAGEIAACCLAPKRTLVDAELVELAHGRDLGVWVWTVNDPREMQRLAALGVDAIFSDYPERFAAPTPRAA
jgi:glycerophosphoryl diester phosphodiesterase